MATLRNKRKLAAVTRETQEEHPRNGQSRNTSVPRINEEYITQVSEEVEGRITKKLSQEFSRTEFSILGALSKLDECFLNQQIRTHSGTVPETFRNTNVDNQGTNEDDFQSDPHPEAGLFRSQTTQTLAQKLVLTWRQELQNATTWWQVLQKKFAMAMTWWQEVQKRFVFVLTWWQELQEKFVTVVTWWQELQNRTGTVVTWWQEFKERFAMATTWWQQFKKTFPTSPLEFPQENKTRRAPQLRHNFAVRTPLRHLKQTRFRWPFSSWRRTVNLPMSITTVTKFQTA